MSITKIKVSPRILQWARTSLHLTEDDVVNHFAQKSKEKFKLDLSLLKRIESNEQDISFTILQELSNLYKRPLAVFFLSSPPAELSLPKDCRTIDSGVHRILSPEAILVFRRTRYVQSIFAELSEELGFDLNLSFPKASLSDNPKKLSERFREILGFSFELQSKKIKDSRELFKTIRERLEGVNVFTLKSSFPLEDARAFSLVDKIPYIIVINNKDGGYFGYAPKTFSLLHEFVHILLSEGAICNDFSRSHQEIEKFCNEFAASFLVPDKYFLDVLKTQSINLNKAEIESSLEKLKSIFKVSKNVLLRKCLSLELINKLSYEQKVKEWEKMYEREERKKSKFVPAITPGLRAINNNSRKFVDIVLHARGLGKITLDKAADYLGVSIKSVSEIENLYIRG